MRQKLLTATLVLAGTVMAGCAGGGYYSSIRYGPPAPRYGAIGYAPGPGYVWADGYWDWRGNNWRWMNGRWMRPPHARARWVAPRWQQQGRGWRMQRGYWR